MKVISFKIPKTKEELFHFQKDRLPHFYDKFHKHPEIQITYIEYSTGTLIAGDYIGKFVPGDIYIIGSTLPHVFRNDFPYYQKKSKEKAIGYSLFIDMEAWQNSFRSGVETAAVGKFFRKINSAYQVRGNLRKIIASGLKQMESATDFESMLLMLDLLYQSFKSKHNFKLIAGHGNWNSIKEHDGIRISEVIRFILEESDRTITLKEVSAVANMSAEAFCRYFKLHTRKTFISFLNEVRINNACKLLVDSEAIKSDIAYQSGFNSLSHFNHTFKRIKGKTPGDYIRMVKKENRF